MKENNKIESLDDNEPLINKNIYQTFFKNRINLIKIIILSLLIICILFLSYFFIILINKSQIKKDIIKDNLKINKIFIEEKENICEIGEEEKCLECNSSNNECSSCNLGYKLIDGKCIANFSFKATYYCNSDNITITLINSTYLKDL